MTRSHSHQAWVDVAIFRSLSDGQALQAFLEGRGVEARAYDDKLFRYFLFLRPPQVTYRVQVRKNDVGHALGFMNSKSPTVLDKALHCPSCGSLQVNYPQMTRKFVLPTVLLHLGIIFRFIEHDCYCEHCHAMWHLPKEDNLAERVHAPRPIAL
jgi:hypothetical protein